MDLDDNPYIHVLCGEEDEDGEGDIGHDFVVPPAATLAAYERPEDVAEN